jgi:coenzyme F420-reducing hydrogenase delta subunit/predicted transcriptional regulator
MDFEPKILSFLCNWCSYAGADFAGVSRFQYPANIRVIRTMCSGRVNPAFVITALLSGSDGVLVLGCHPGDCHYLTGNYHAQKKMAMTGKLLEMAKVPSDRLRLDWVSASEGKRFAEIVTSFTNRIKSLGPLTKDDHDGLLRHRLQAVKSTVESERISWLIGNEISLLEKGNVFGDKLAPDQLESLLSTAANDEYARNLIATLMQEHAMSVGEVAQATGLDPKTVSSYLVDLQQAGAVALQTFEDRTPKYIKTQASN